MASVPARSARTRPARLRRLASCALLALLAVGCVSEKREQEIGDAIAADINAQIPLVHDPILNAYVASLGQVLASVSERPKVGYEFYIINSAAVNAFALPGGHIYITRGLIEETSSGAELAAVLAHEIGHVAARHGVEKMQRHLRTGSLVSLLYTLFLGGEPEILRSNATQLAGVLWSASHSREDEHEADALGVEYLVRAGVDPEGMLTLLQALIAAEAQETSSGALSWFSTHPLTAERLEAARKEIREELKETTPAAELKIASYPAFLRRIAALPPPPDIL